MPIYLPSGAEATPISPTPDAAWEDTSILARVKCSTSKRSLAMTTVSFTDSNWSNKDILFRQWINELVPGRLILGGYYFTGQCRVYQPDLMNGMFLTFGIRILAGNGTDVRKTLVPVTSDNLLAPSDVLTNRSWGVTAASGNYTTQAGDCLVIEGGMGGNPDEIGPPVGYPNHSSSMRFGDASETDLPLWDNSQSADYCPYIIRLNQEYEEDILTFVSAGCEWKRHCENLIVEPPVAVAY